MNWDCFKRVIGATAYHEPLFLPSNDAPGEFSLRMLVDKKYIYIYKMYIKQTFETDSHL